MFAWNGRCLICVNNQPITPFTPPRHRVFVCVTCFSVYTCIYMCK